MHLKSFWARLRWCVSWTEHLCVDQNRLNDLLAKLKNWRSVCQNKHLQRVFPRILSEIAIQDNSSESDEFDYIRNRASIHLAWTWTFDFKKLDFG